MEDFAKKVLIQFADFAHDHVSCFIMIGTTDSHAIVSYQNPICLLTLLDFRTCLFQGVAKKKDKKKERQIIFLSKIFPSNHLKSICFAS